MTLRYTHLTTDHKQRAVQVLEQFGIESPQISLQGEEAEPTDLRNVMKIRVLS